MVHFDAYLNDFSGVAGAVVTPLCERSQFNLRSQCTVTWFMIELQRFIIYNARRVEKRESAQSYLPRMFSASLSDSVDESSKLEQGENHV